MSQYKNLMHILKTIDFAKRKCMNLEAFSDRCLALPLGPTPVYQEERVALRQMEVN